MIAYTRLLPDWLRAHPQAHNTLNTLLSVLSTSAQPLSFEEWLALADRAQIFVAHENDELVGMATLCAHDKPSGFEGYLHDTAVLKELQGRGIGRGLVTYVLEQAKQAGMVAVQWTSKPSRVQANALYAKIGAERVETNVWKKSL